MVNGSGSRGRFQVEKGIIDKSQLDPDVITCLPEDVIKKYRVLPLQKVGSRLVVAMAGPLDLDVLDDLRLVTGGEIEPVMVEEEELENSIQKLFGFNELEVSLSGEVPGETGVVDVDRQAGDAGDSPLVRLVNSLITGAVGEGASDIHIEPREHGVKVRYRVDGMLRDVWDLPAASKAALISRLKIMAEMNIAEKKVPQDGRIKVKCGGRKIDLRISTMPTVFGEKVVVRVLDRKNEMLSLPRLGFQERNLEHFREAIQNTYGMILLTGPTGSGKTTTLYAVLKELSTPEKNIVTIEDPVEYILEGINQSQVNSKTGFTFARGLRSLMRQDPDVIMVGEIRDAETAGIAVHAAITGHLVFSTLHTAGAPGALVRLVDMGVEPYLVASSVLAVVSQRLVRKICPGCRRAYRLSPGSPEYSFINPPDGGEVELYTGTGCSYCKYTGYRGRVSIQEIMPVTEKVRSRVKERAYVEEIRRAAEAEGMAGLREDGICKALQGITTVEEVMKAALARDVEGGQP